MLPSSVRPLLCRLYPYQFTPEGITKTSFFCPISHMEDPATILSAMGMSMETANRWHKQLYDEIYREREMDRSSDSWK